jgi:hypothetical protein
MIARDEGQVDRFLLVPQRRCLSCGAFRRFLACLGRDYPRDKSATAGLVGCIERSEMRFYPDSNADDALRAWSLADRSRWGGAMSQSNLLSNASLAEPSNAECKELRALSKTLLEECWDNPDKVGLHSALLERVERHLALVRQYRTPAAPTSPDQSNSRLTFIAALRLAWFATWLARDYSLDGWRMRIDEGLNVQLQPFMHGQGPSRVAKRSWLPMHHPLFDRDGELLSEDRPAFSDRLRLADNHLLLEGAQVGSATQLSQIWPAIPNASLKWAYVAKEASAHVPGDWGLESALCESLLQRPSGQGARQNYFSNGIVIGTAKFASLAAMSGFEGARFEGGLEISSLSGLQGRLFPSSFFVGQKFLLDSGETAGALDINRADGVRRIELRNVTVNGDIRFAARSVPLSLELLSNNTIRGGISASDVTFANLQISCGFERESSFKSCRFIAPPRFAGSRFSGGLILEDCEVGSGDAGVVDFRGLTIGVQLELKGGVYGAGPGSHVDFSGIKSPTANIFGVDFNCRVDLGTHPGTKLNIDRLDNKQTVFRDRADFRNPSDTAGIARAEFSLKGCRFLEVADFQNVAFGDSTVFDECVFCAAPKFFGATLHPDTSFRGVRFEWKPKRQTKFLDRAVFGRLSRALGNGKIFGGSLARVRRDNLLLGEVERSFTALRELANKIQAKQPAARFHKQELEARRLRVLDPDVPRPEAWASWIYHALSDYGDSFARPVGLLAVYSFLWTGIYIWMSGSMQNASAAGSISLAGTLKPWASLDSSIARAASEWGGVCKEIAEYHKFKMMASQNEHCLAVQLTHDYGFWFHLIATAQSAISIILIFLMALALRRKFQLI